MCFYIGASLTLQNVKIIAIRDVLLPIFSMAVIVVYERSFSGPVVLLNDTTRPQIDHYNSIYTYKWMDKY